MATMTMVTRKIRMMTMTTTTKIEIVRFLNEDDYEDFLDTKWCSRLKSALSARTS